MSSVNITSVKASSDGAWQDDNPLNFAFPLLIVQILIVIVMSRTLAFALKPLRQPKVIAEILGGILLGPSAMGRNKNFIKWIFPSWSTPILESVASIGLLFFLFLVGLELDLSSIRRSGKRAFIIAAAGVSLPFTLAAGVTLILRKFTTETSNSSYGQSLIFLGVSLSITAFPVLARILAELKLLTTHVGETAMAAAAFNDVVAWLMLALAIALTSNKGPGSPHHSPLTTVWILISSVAFVTFMLTVVRPAMSWVAKKCSPRHDMVDEAYICLTLAGVMVSGFVTDLIGIHAIFGAFVFGLSVPKEGDFAGKLIKRIEDFVSSLLLPLYFASSGLKTNVADLQGLQSWGILVLVISTACAGKILGTFVVAMLCMIPARESLTLGLLMNTKGLVELIVLNIGREKKILNDELFTILVLMALFTTFMTTPTVLAIYKPALQSGSRSHSHSLSQSSHCGRPSSTGQPDAYDEELRIMSCVHGTGNVASMVNLIELTRGAKKSVVKLYSMHLVELTDRSSSIMMVQRARKNGFPFVNRFARGKNHDQVAVAFEAYAEVSRVNVRPTTAISALHTMHEDICHVAKRKRATIIILPYHKQWSTDGEEMEHLGHCWRLVNQRVFADAPCSVALLVDRGFGDPKYYRNQDDLKRVCVLFFGGPNDSEALELGGRMSEGDVAVVTVIRFIPTDEQDSANLMLHPSSYDHAIKNSSNLDLAKEKDLDEAAFAEFQLMKWSKRVEYIERKANNAVEQVVGIGTSGEYELIIVGKARFQATSDTESAELGPVGDALASSNSGIISSVLIIQQHVSAIGNETRAPNAGPAGNGGSSV